MSTLAKTTSLSSSTRESTHFTVLVDRVDNPVDTRVVSDPLVGRIYQNYFIVLAGSVLIDPVTVQNTEIGVATSDFLFGYRLQIAFKLQMVDTLMLGLSKYHTAVVLTLASSTTDSGTNNYVALFALVAKTMGLVGPRRTVDGDDLGALTVLPGTNTEQEAEGVGLFMTP